MDAIHVRVGNMSQSVESRRGFDANDWCALQLTVSGHEDIRCARPIHGRYVSIQTVDNLLTGTTAGRLQLCDVTVY